MNEKLKQTIKDEIALLEGWISMSIYGGWSTHLVEPMQKRVNELKTLMYDINK